LPPFNIKTQPAVLRTIYEVQVKYNRTFAQMKLSTIQMLLKIHYKINVTLSDVSYHLGVLRKNKLISVWERYGTNPNGTHFNLPSNRSITAKGLNYLKQHGIKIASFLYDWAFKGIKPERYKHPEDLRLQKNVFERPQRTPTKTPVRISDLLPVITHALT